MGDAGQSADVWAGGAAAFDAAGTGGGRAGVVDEHGGESAVRGGAVFPGGISGEKNHRGGFAIGALGGMGKYSCPCRCQRVRVSEYAYPCHPIQKLRESRRDEQDAEISDD